MLKKIRAIAKRAGYNEILHIDRQKIISFKKNDVERIDIYYSKMTVGFTFLHPEEGKKQVFKKNISLNQLKKIFSDPMLYSVKCYSSKYELNANLVYDSYINMGCDGGYADYKRLQYKEDLSLEQKKEAERLNRLREGVHNVV